MSFVIPIGENKSSKSELLLNLKTKNKIYLLFHFIKVTKIFIFKIYIKTKSYSNE